MLDGHQGAPTQAQNPASTDGQADAGEISLSRALDLATQLESIVGALRIDVTAIEYRERELREIIVGLLTGKEWAADRARADPEIGPAYLEAIADMEQEVSLGDDLPF